MTTGKEYYDLRGLNKHGILIPRRVPVEATVRMTAALMSYDMGNKSVDYQLKQYRADLEEPIREQHRE